MTISFGDDRLPARFWTKVTPEPNSGCWLWTARCFENGYGQFKWNGENVGAHRHAYQILIGFVAKDRQCDHQCWVRSCCNPAHIRIATPQQNADNRSLQGRRAQADSLRLTMARPEIINRMRGIHTGNKWGAKLTASQVLQIRDIFATGYLTQAEVGILFGVSDKTIGHIVNRRGWKNV